MDYSINYYAPLKLLIATMKYTGSDYEADMKKVSEKKRLIRVGEKWVVAQEVAGRAWRKMMTVVSELEVKRKCRSS